jgi:Sel1 repeat
MTVLAKDDSKVDALYYLG